MRNFIQASVWVICGLTLGFTGLVFGQGSLTPPGAPAPTMKTLAQIEPRTLVNASNTPGDASAVFIINQPGSYYLTTNLDGVSGKSGIRIDANNVTLDLMGFVVGGVASAQSGILASSTAAGLSLANGTISGWPQYGLDARPAGSCLLKELRALSNGNGGLATGDGASVKDCVATGNSGIGISVGNHATVAACLANQNGSDGIRAAGDCSLVGNHSSSNGADGIRTTGTNNRIDSNHASDNSGYGIHSDSGTGADVTVRNTARNNSQGGYQPASGITFGPLGTPASSVSAWANFLSSAGFTVSKLGNGTGTVVSSPAGINCGANCSNNFENGASVTLTATPATHSLFTGWSGDASGTGTANITVDGPKSVNATFTLEQFGLSINSGSGGTISSSPAGINCGASCSANFDYGTLVTLTPTPSSGASFAGWSGVDSIVGNNGLVTINSAKSVTATFAYPLNVARAGGGGGTVSSSPAGISCGATCSSNFNSGATVTLTATPALGATFSSWAGADSTSGSTATVAMNAVRNVTATFAYPMTVNNAGGGTVSSSPAGINCGATCSSYFSYGSTVTLTATPNAGATFVGWTGACSGTGTCTVSMDSAKSATATFVYPLTVTRTGNGGGTVTSSPVGISCDTTCSTSFSAGTTVTLTATPSTGAVFVGWSGADSVSGNTATVTMDSVKNVNATFAFPVVVNNAGGGTVTSSPVGISCGSTCSNNFAYGTVVTLTATPNTGATFAGWTGACTGTGTCNVTADAARSTAVRFTYPLTVSKNGLGGGSVTTTPAGISCGGNCSTSFDAGTVVTLTAAPDASSTFSGWSGGGCTGTGTCTVTMDAAKSATATFTPIPYTLTVTKAGAGIGTVTSSPAGINCPGTCSANYNANTVVTLTAVANPGSTFVGWSGACAGTGTCISTMSGNRSVTATFTSP